MHHPNDRDILDRGVASPGRRRLFAAAAALTGSLAAWPTLTLAGAAGPGGNRLVLVILRGGLDGLGAVPAVGDADFAAARGPLGQFATPALPVDATFSLHPSLVELHAMVGQGFFLPELHRLRGEVLRADGDATAARREFIAARDLADAQGARSLALRAAMSIGRADGPAACDDLARRLAQIDGGADTKDGIAARALLE